MNEAEDILSMLGGQSSVDILSLMGEDDEQGAAPDEAWLDEAPSGALLKMEAKRRVCFDLTLSMHTLLRFLENPPAPGECFKLLSDAGGWSSCSLIMWLAQKEPILDLYCSTFRVGTKEIGQLERLHEAGESAQRSLYCLGWSSGTIPASLKSTTITRFSRRCASATAGGTPT